MPIAITRTVRKIVFRWAFREVRGPAIESTDPESKSGTPDLTRPNPVESYLVLRDFFQHCERSDSADAERPALSESGRTGVLSASEQQVVTKLKLEGLSAKELAQLDGSTSEEAVHHRSHRIMARLRKVASRLRSNAHR